MTVSESEGGGVCPPQPPSASALALDFPHSTALHPFKRRASFLSKGGSRHTAEPAKVVVYKSMLALLGSGLSSELPRWRAGLGLRGSQTREGEGKWGHSWAWAPVAAAHLCLKDLGLERKCPRSFYADYRDFLTPESQAGTRL